MKIKLAPQLRLNLYFCTALSIGYYLYLAYLFSGPGIYMVRDLPVIVVWMVLIGLWPVFLWFPNHKKLAEIRSYIDQHLCDTVLRVSDLAEMFGTSEVYFRREFKRYYGLTPIEYIKKRRLETACQLLSTNLYPVAEVAIRSGFDSISYFSSEFRRHFGCSPREYKTL